MTNKFADPKLDIVFKKLFGDSAILVDFINKTLPTKHIKKVEYLSTNIEPEIRVKKQSVLDVLCTDENGSKYIVEMQSAKEKGFEKEHYTTPPKPMDHNWIKEADMQIYWK